MEREELLAFLAELAEEAGIRVSRLPVAEGVAPARSGACRLRGATWVWLAPGDPVEDRIEALAGALRREAGAFLEGRYLPPAVRERLDAADPPAAGLGADPDASVPPGR